MSMPYVEYQYAYSDHSHPGLADKITQLIASYGQVKSVCELGCGSGWLANQLAAKDYAVTGVDASASGICAAQAANGKGVFVCDSIDGLLASRLGQRFDLVLSSEVIEHLYRPAVLLEAAEQLLKPEGYLVISTPYHGYLKYLVLALLGKMDRHLTANWDGGHIKFFSPATMRELLQTHGFTVLRFVYWGRFTGLWKSMICVAQRTHRRV